MLICSIAFIKRIKKWHVYEILRENSFWFRHERQFHSYRINWKTDLSLSIVKPECQGNVSIVLFQV